MKVKAFFSRRVPFFVLGTQDISDTEGFDAYPIMIEDTVLANVRALRRLNGRMTDLFELNAPEECAQDEADFFETEAMKIFKTRAQ